MTRIRIAADSEKLDFALGLHPVFVPGGLFLHDAAADALIGRLDGSGKPFADEAEAKAAVDWIERMRCFQNS